MSSSPKSPISSPFTLRREGYLFCRREKIYLRSYLFPFIFRRSFCCQSCAQANLRRFTMDPPLPTFATLSPNMDPPPPLPHVRSSSLDSIPRRRVVIYGMCALFFTTVVILFNALISFLEKLITNEAWWSYLEDTIKCHKEPCSPLARFVGINVTNTFRSCFLSSCASVSAYLVKMQHSCCTGQEVGPLSNPSLSCSGD
jgi:hypothetical protein